MANSQSGRTPGTPKQGELWKKERWSHLPDAEGARHEGKEEKATSHMAKRR